MSESDYISSMELEYLYELNSRKSTSLSDLKELRLQIPGLAEFQLKRPRTDLEPETELDFEANDE